MRIELLLAAVVMVITGPATASCMGDGKSCIEDIYKAEKENKQSRTRIGSFLDDELPNNSSIERNVDLSDYATKADLSISASNTRNTAYQWDMEALLLKSMELNHEATI